MKLRVSGGMSDGGMRGGPFPSRDEWRAGGWRDEWRNEGWLRVSGGMNRG